MNTRVLALALVLTLTGLVAVSPSAADDPSAVCPTSASPLELTSGVPVLGFDPSTSLADDCYFLFHPVGDPTGKQVRVTLSTTVNHNPFVKENVPADAAPYACSSTSTSATTDACTAPWPIVVSAYSIRISRAAAGTTTGDFTLTLFYENAPASGCSNGFAVTPITTGTPIAATLTDTVGAQCHFVYLPPNPLADPSNPGDDVLRFENTPATGNLDLFVRRGLPALNTPTANRDCASALTGTAIDVCEVAVSSGAPVYIQVRRTTLGGSFSLVETPNGNSCELGAGYHALPNGLDVHGSLRGIIGAKCYFSLESSSANDLLSVKQAADTPNSAFGLSLAKDVPFGPGTVDCSASSFFISIPAFGIELKQAAQCDRLLEDGLAHDWFISVARGSAGTSWQFTVNGYAQTIPTLLSGVPQVGHVDAGETQYWKVVLPEDASTLTIQTAGDPSNLACALGGQANSLVTTACLLLPFPMLIGCALLAGQGVSCDQLETTAYERCLAETGDVATCTQAEALRIRACNILNAQSPGSCDAEDTEGSVAGSCSLVNQLTGDTTCDLGGTSIKTPEIDLVVRYRLGLPSTTVNDCRSATPGLFERCIFDDRVVELHDNTTEPARQDLNARIQEIRQIIDENRTLLDDNITGLLGLLLETVHSVVDPVWDLLRTLLFDLLGVDIGAFPADPSAALPATPNAAVADQFAAYPLPGAGKYFVAVRGPLDIASQLFYKGGDYAIVAVHDSPQVPSDEEIQQQIDGLNGTLNDLLGSLPAVPEPPTPPTLPSPLGQIISRVVRLLL